MSTSQDIAEVDALSTDDPNLLEKLNEIALRVAASKGKTTTYSASGAPIDPSDAFACEGCQ